MKPTDKASKPSFALFADERLNALRPLSAPLLAWYDAHARKLPWRQNHDAYRVWISEIMLQQTRVEAVIPYFERFIAALPGLPALAAVPQDRLMKLWEGLGYYSRARNLQRAAQAVLASGRTALPASYEALLALPGIGPYTAGAVASIAYGIAVPAVDGNVLRVLARLLACDADIALPPVKRAFERAAAAIQPKGRPGDFNQAMMELGATVCGPGGAPHCESCPVRAFCAGAGEGEPERYPYKSPKKPRAVEERTVFAAVAQGRVLLRRREERGLLAGLWELPNLAGRMEEADVSALAEAWGLGPVAVRPMGEGKHIFTHIEWRMRGFALLCGSCMPVEGAVWADAAELAERYALPSAFRPFARQLPLLLAETAGRQEP